jgi:hypothetical protein
MEAIPEDGQDEKDVIKELPQPKSFDPKMPRGASFRQSGGRMSISGESTNNRRTSISSPPSNGNSPPSGASRRTSIVGQSIRGRRRSLMMDKQGFDEEALKIFFATHGLTAQDINIGFDFLSRDKKKITHGDIKAFIGTYFDWFPEEAMSLLNAWKEEVSKEQLNSILLSKSLMSSPYDNAFKVTFFINQSVVVSGR